MGRNDAIVIEQNINAPEIKNIIENITIALSQIDQKRRDLKTTRGSIDELLKSDQTYSLKKEDMDLQKQTLTESKDKVLATSEGQHLLEIQDKLKQEITDLQDTLSPALEVLYQKTKRTEFTDSNGVKRFIKKKFSIAPGQQSMF